MPQGRQNIELDKEALVDRRAPPSNAEFNTRQGSWKMVVSHFQAAHHSLKKPAA